MQKTFEKKEMTEKELDDEILKYFPNSFSAAMIRLKRAMENLTKAIWESFKRGKK